MPGTYNTNALVAQLKDAVALDPKVKAEAWSKLLHLGARAHDDFSAFESDECRPGTQRSMTSPAGIFVRKNDLKAIGGDTVRFTVMSDLAGPGVQGEEELTGKTSVPKFSTYSCVVDWHRDAVEFTKKHIAMMGAGKDIWPVSYEALKKKMGRWRQRHMMHALRRKGVGNIYRPNGRQALNQIVSSDTLTPQNCVAGKIRLSRLGAQPIRLDKNRFGSTVQGYLVFATEQALQSVRNNTGYQNAIQNAGLRGDKNPAFTGRLVEWQNVSWFEHHVVDPDWDDVIGSPMEPRATLGVPFHVGSTPAAAKLVVNSSNTRNLYFQDFPGYDYRFFEDQSAVADSGKHYAWIINPDGSVGFVEYTGSGNNGNQIVIDKILSPNGAGTSAKGSAIVGEINCTGDTAWGSSTAGYGGDGSGNTSPEFRYTDAFVPGATILYANAKGVPIGWSFIFGAHAAIRAYGSVEMNAIEQKRDYDFVTGHGYEMVFGQEPCKRTDGKTNGYLLMQHALEIDDLPVPSLDS